jgi:hypothetical protein
MTQVVEHLPNKCEALSSNPSTRKKKKKLENRRKSNQCKPEEGNIESKKTNKMEKWKMREKQ